MQDGKGLPHHRVFFLCIALLTWFPSWMFVPAHNKCPSYASPDSSHTLPLTLYLLKVIYSLFIIWSGAVSQSSLKALCTLSYFQHIPPPPHTILCVVRQRASSDGFAQPPSGDADALQRCRGAKKWWRGSKSSVMAFYTLFYDVLV